MSAEADLQTLLAGTAAVTAICSTRIAQDRAEQDWARPFVIYTRTGTERFQTLDGSTPDEKVTFAVECWADTRLVADALADAVTTAIDGGDNGTILDYATGYDPDLDAESTSLIVEWWT